MQTYLSLTVYTLKVSKLNWGKFILLAMVMDKKGESPDTKWGNVTLKGF